MSDIFRSIEIVKKAWVESPYYQSAEKWTDIFWNPGSDFLSYFDELDVSRCADLACGHGWHAERLMRTKGQHIETLYCLDIIETNISITAKRLAKPDKITCILTNGKDFRPIGDGSLTAIYCYDAMVHFSGDIVESYLCDAYRVLRPGGRALLHHSNLNAPRTGHPDNPYGGNPHARNHMTLSLFSSLVLKSGLKIVKTHSRAWGTRAQIASSSTRRPAPRFSIVRRPTMLCTRRRYRFSKRRPRSSFEAEPL